MTCSLFRVDPADRLYDATGFCETLRAECYFHRTHVDAAGRLERAFWPVKIAGDMSSLLFGARQAVQYDNTFNTNAYDLKLGVFTTVDANGRTRIVACCLLRFETKAAFEWVLASFQMCFELQARVVLSDGDIAFAGALKVVWPAATHLLCVWHLARNVAKHCKGCFAQGRVRRQAGTNWSRFYSRFWNIVHCTDSSSIDYFDREWVALLALLEDDATASGDVVSRALVYLGSPDEYGAEDCDAACGGDDAVCGGDGEEGFDDSIEWPTESLDPAAAEGVCHSGCDDAGISGVSGSGGSDDIDDIAAAIGAGHHGARDGVSGGCSCGDQGVHQADASSGTCGPRESRSLSVYAQRGLWAYRYTWQHFTFGANSTQRGEAVFALIKSRIRPGGLLTDLYKRLERLDQEMADLSKKLSDRALSRFCVSVCVPILA